MGLSTFIKNLLPDFLKSSPKIEECATDCVCEESPVVESIQDVSASPLQVVEPKVNQVVERLAEVSAKEIKSKVSKKKPSTKVVKGKTKTTKKPSK